MTLKHRKYPTIEEARTHLTGLGNLKYYGIDGKDRFIYTLTITGRTYYILYLHKNGLVELYEEVYKTW